MGSKAKTRRRNEGPLTLSQPALARSVLILRPPYGVSAEIEKNDSFQVFFTNSLIPLYIFDRDTLQFLETNDATVAQYGYTRTELLALDATVFQPNEEIARLVTFDMTEMLRAEASLRYSTEHVYQLTDNLDSVFWVATPTLSRFLYISAAYEKVWGRGRAGLYSNAWALLDTIHPEDRVRVEDATRNSFADFDQEYRITRPDGEVRWIHGRAFPIRGPKGEIIRVAGIA